MRRLDRRGVRVNRVAGGENTAIFVGVERADIESAVDGLEPESKHAAQLCIDGVRQLHAMWQTV